MDRAALERADLSVPRVQRLLGLLGATEAPSNVGLPYAAVTVQGLPHAYRQHADEYEQQLMVMLLRCMPMVRHEGRRFLHPCLSGRSLSEMQHSCVVGGVALEQAFRSAEAQQRVGVLMWVCMHVSADEEDVRARLGSEAFAKLCAYIKGAAPRRATMPDAAERAAIRRGLGGVFPIAPAFAKEATASAMSTCVVEVATSTDVPELAQALVRFHNAFVSMHPLVDKNGRTARAVCNALLFANGCEPVLAGRGAAAEAYGRAVRADVAEADDDDDPRPPKVNTRAVGRLLLGALAHTRETRRCWGCGAAGTARACVKCTFARFCTACKKVAGKDHAAWCSGAVSGLIGQS